MKRLAAALSMLVISIQAIQLDNNNELQQYNEVSETTVARII